MAALQSMWTGVRGTASCLDQTSSYRTSPVFVPIASWLVSSVETSWLEGNAEEMTASPSITLDPKWLVYASINWLSGRWGLSHRTC